MASGTHKAPLMPWEWDRPPWRKDERIRVLVSSAGSDSPAALVWLEHREHPNLAFRLEIARNGSVVGFQIRPLVFVGEYRADGSLVTAGFDLDETALSTDAPPITTTLTRKIKVDELQQAALVGLELHGRAVGAEVPTEKPKRERRSIHSDEDLARFAEQWHELLINGVKNPMDVMAERESSRERADYMKKRAVKRGLLTTTTQGKTGGYLTAKARAILDVAR